jgi:RNA polymerase subunit RPABC4/transcription elongation factor Spt4
VKEFGYYVEEDVMVCPKCAENPDYVGLLSPAEIEGYPDGYSCDDCNTVVEGDGDGGGEA